MSRTKPLQINLLEAEKAEIAAAASREGLPLASFVRVVTLRAIRQPSGPLPDIIERLRVRIKALRAQAKVEEGEETRRLNALAVTIAGHLDAARFVESRERAIKGLVTLGEINETEAAVLAAQLKEG